MVEAIYLIIAIISYLGARKAGLSKGQSALVAAGVTGAAYKFGVGDKVADWVGSLGSGSGDTDLDPTDAISTPGDSVMDKLTGFLGSTAGKIGLGAVAGSVVTDRYGWLPWVIGGGALFLLLK